MHNPAMLPFFVSGCSSSDMGQLAEILPESRRVFVPRWGRTRGKIAFSPEKHCGLVILGDSRHWATDQRYQWDRGMLVTALEAKRPVLGICFGAQLLAAHLAGKYDGQSLAEKPGPDHVGKFAAVKIDDLSVDDPVVGHLADGTAVPQWHEDSFLKPPGADGLAWSTGLAQEHCEAFRVGNPKAAVYGIQFHPEPTLETLLREEADERWFETIPPLGDLEKAVVAGGKLLRAWIRLADAAVQ